MRLLSSGLFWPRILFICFFCQSIFAYPSTLSSSNDISTDLDNSSKNSAESEKVILTLDKQSDDLVNSEKKTLSYDGSRSKNQEEKSAYEYLSKYGYLAKENNDRPFSIISLTGPLKKMQEFSGIPVSGKLDDATKKRIMGKRCGLKDIVEPISSFGKRFDARAGWKRRFLTYRILGHPTNSYNLQKNRVETLIETAFKDWSSVANINFRKTTSDFYDIEIDFLKGDHGDGENFDGLGSILAHASLPEAGRLHFDDDEIWTDGYFSVQTSDLRQVATHEIGHILGLAHSRLRNAVMFSDFIHRPNFKLAVDDIDGAVYLYGRNQVEATTRNPVFPFSSTTRRTAITTQKTTTTQIATTTRKSTTIRRTTTRLRHTPRLRPTPRRRYTPKLRPTPRLGYTPRLRPTPRRGFTPILFTLPRFRYTPSAILNYHQRRRNEFNGWQLN